jgi:hypothetical protein
VEEAPGVAAVAKSCFPFPMSRVDFPHKAQIIHRQFTRPSARVSSRLLNAVALSLPKSRFLSSATTDEGSRTASPLSKENIISKRLATRNLLKNVKSVLPTAFPADRQDLAEVWSTRLDSAFADLAVTRGTRIAGSVLDFIEPFYYIVY